MASSTTTSERDVAADAFLSVITNGKVMNDEIGPHGDLLDEFPYLGPRAHESINWSSSLVSKHSSKADDGPADSRTRGIPERGQSPRCLRGRGNASYGSEDTVEPRGLAACQIRSCSSEEQNAR